MFNRKKILEGIEKTRKEKAQNYGSEKESLFSTVRKALERMQVLGVYGVTYVPDYPSPEYDVLTRYLAVENGPDDDLNKEFKEYVIKPFHAQLKVDDIGVYIQKEQGSFRPTITVTIQKDLPTTDEEKETPVL